MGFLDSIKKFFGGKEKPAEGAQEQKTEAPAETPQEESNSGQDQPAQ